MSYKEDPSEQILIFILSIVHNHHDVSECWINLSWQEFTLVLSYVLDPVLKLWVSEPGGTLLLQSSVRLFYHF